MRNWPAPDGSHMAARFGRPSDQGVWFGSGDFRRLMAAPVILACVYFSLSSYLRCYFACSRVDEWSSGPGQRARVRYFSSSQERLLFMPAVFVESVIVHRRVNAEVSK